MMMEKKQINFPRYEHYKDSGIEWIGEIPAHWRLVPNKWIFKESKTRVGKRSREFTLLSLTLRGVIQRDMDNPEGKFPAEFDGYQIVNKGDFVFCHFDVEETPRTVGLSNYHGMITGAYTVYKVEKKYNSKYLYYFYLYADVNKNFRFLYRGLRNTIPSDSFNSFKSPIPPLPEQTAIAQFLDQKTAQIDRAIAIKEAQIKLLNERKQIMIQEAVTKGLDPSVPMKDSGIEWIGEIPAHWEVLPIKYLKKNIKNSFVDGPFGSNLKNEHFVDDGDVYVVESGLITSGLYQHRELKTIKFSHFKTISRSECQTGDIIIAKIGANFGMAGELPKLDKRSVVSGNTLKLTLNNNVILNMYFIDLMGMAKKMGGFEDIVNTSAQPALSLGGLNNMSFPVPPINEQILICLLLDEIQKNFQIVNSNLKSQIQTLKEYKTTLINEAVTGKIKVY